ncbi:MAG: GNAT family N-acetyltransferase, partial [Bacteroidota bacterium]|nr:GNAT family N-acetyltransferase [Bacteroidota bacterium]
MEFRKATSEDVPTIVKMIADDALGSKRENYTIPLPKKYYDAFERIDSDHNQELIVIENENGQVIAVFQMTFIPYLTYQGGIRAQIEGVRVHKDHRGLGIGKKVFEWAIRRAKERNAHLLQFTTDKKRPHANRLYESLGFKANHEGMKMQF